MSGEENDASWAKPRDEAGECSARRNVEMVRGFVQDKNGWVADDGAGDGEALPFAARKHAVARADACLESIGEALYDGFESAESERLVDIWLRVGRVSQGDVVPNCSIDDEVVLANDGEALAENGGVERGERTAVDENLAFLRLQGTEGELEECGFSRAVGSEKSNHGIRVDCGGKIADYRAIGFLWIGECNMVKCERAEGVGANGALFDRRAVKYFVQRINAFAQGGEVGKQSNDALDGLKRRDEEHLVENDVANGYGAIRRKRARNAEYGDFASDEKGAEEESEAAGERIGNVVAVA